MGLDIFSIVILEIELGVLLIALSFEIAGGYYIAEDIRNWTLMITIITIIVLALLYGIIYLFTSSEWYNIIFGICICSLILSVFMHMITSEDGIFFVIYVIIFGVAIAVGLILLCMYWILWAGIIISIIVAIIFIAIVSVIAESLDLYF